MKQIEFFNNVLKDVNMWLHYIEAKNALLIGFDAAIFSSLCSAAIWNKGFNTLIYVILALLVCSILVCICSFIPINFLLKRKKKHNVNENLLNYAYISSLDAITYFNMVSEKYFDCLGENNTYKNLCMDYCVEIIENSRIALRKQDIFTLSLKLNIVDLSLFLICIIIA